jgi:hypothetical protein
MRGFDKGFMSLRAVIAIGAPDPMSFFTRSAATQASGLRLRRSIGLWENSAAQT